MRGTQRLSSKLKGSAICSLDLDDSHMLALFEIRFAKLLPWPLVG
jgi:hypothetical protein